MKYSETILAFISGRKWVSGQCDGKMYSGQDQVSVAEVYLGIRGMRRSV